MKIVRACVAVAVVGLSLSGCMGPPTDSPIGGPSSAASSTATPTPTPTQERETGLVAPAQVFGGDCGAVLTNAELSSALGIPMAPSSYANFDPGHAVEQVGGLNCTWDGPDPGTSFVVSIVVMPAAAVSYTAPTGCGLDLYDATGCTLEAEQNGIRLSGAILDGYGGAHSTAAMQSALIAAFEAHASSAVSVPVPLPAAGSWDTTPDCAAVVALGDYSAVPGLGAGASGEDWGGFDGYFPPAMSALWSQFSPTGCGLIGPDAEIGFSASGGLRWLGAEVAAAAGATALSVPGIDEVWVSPADSRFTINVLDGPNWLNFDVGHVSNAAAIAQQLVTALDTTAIP